MLEEPRMEAAVVGGVDERVIGTGIVVLLGTVNEDHSGAAVH